MIDEYGNEYWSARELAPILEYSDWRNFSKVIDRAKLACRNSGFEVSDHFSEVTKTIGSESGRIRNVKDHRLSRYACYLVVQNGDPRKEAVALGKTYIAMQTRRQELQDHPISGSARQRNQIIAEVAHSAGLISDAEYASVRSMSREDLYGGELMELLYKRKGLRTEENKTSLSNGSGMVANLFRIMQNEGRIHSEDQRTMPKTKRFKMLDE